MKWNIQKQEEERTDTARMMFKDMGVRICRSASYELSRQEISVVWRPKLLVIICMQIGEKISTNEMK